MAGVGMRCRSLTGCPVASSSIAFSPEPPISMARVMGPRVVFETAFAAGVMEADAFGFISRNCTVLASYRATPALTPVLRALPSVPQRPDHLLQDQPGRQRYQEARQ